MILLQFFCSLFAVSRVVSVNLFNCTIVLSFCFRCLDLKCLARWIIIVFDPIYLFASSWWEQIGRSNDYSRIQCRKIYEISHFKKMFIFFSKFNPMKKKHENFPYAGFLALDFSFFFLFKCIFQNIYFIRFSLMFINNLYPYEYAFECVKIEKSDLKTWKKCVLSISMRNPWRVYFEKRHYMGSHYNIKIRLPNIVIVCIWFLFVDFITLTRFNSSISFWALCFFMREKTHHRNIFLNLHKKSTFF